MSLSIYNNLMATNSARHLGNHYSRLSKSTQRLSSGLRVNSAADDAAGLAIRELMRTDIASLKQGMRNVNDAISVVQTADGALAIIDEKLIRMKELAEQAATGSYDSTQRQLIDSEFQAMASEIDRIAKSTAFNGLKLLDGSLSGTHNGAGLISTGVMKIHFGSGNNSAEDYYYLDIGDATLAGLGLRGGGAAGGAGGAGFGNIPILSDKIPKNVQQRFTSGLVSFAVIPAGTTGLEFFLDDNGQNDTLQVFTRSGKHLAGTKLGRNWGVPAYIDPQPSDFMTEDNGFLPGAVFDDSEFNGIGADLTFIDENTLQHFTVNGMDIGYTGSANRGLPPLSPFERLTIDEAAEDLVVMVVGGGFFRMTADWTTMPTAGGGGAPPGDPRGDILSIKTQDLAQEALPQLDEAMIRKDSIRASLGATQNRLENTVSNLAIQAENMQAAESRISDVDVSQEMTEFIRTQILAQASTAMLAQANSLPRMFTKLLEG